MCALGVILYELCSLRKPFVGTNEEELYKKVREGKPFIISSIPRQLMTIIQGLLCKDPARRLSCQDLFNMEYLRSKA